MNRYLLAIGWLFAALFVHGTAWAQRGPSRVEVMPAVEREVASGQTFVGTVTPTRRAVVGSAVDGRVIEMLVEEGDRVAEGQPLAQLLTQTISLELEAAEAELALRREELAELENGTRPEDIEQARSRMERTRVAAEYLEKERIRLSQLSERNATSASELDRAASAALEAKEAYAEAKAAHELAVAGPRAEQIAQARAQVAMQDAIVRRLRDQIEKYTIRSRFAGYVTVKHTDVGAWVTRGDPVAEVVALDDVDIVAKVVESQTPYIKVGDSARVEVSAVPGKPLTGTVVAVVPQADVRSRTFPVKVRVKNELVGDEEPLLKAGMLARVTLATGERTEATLVPKDALVLGGRQPLVWVIRPDSIKSASGKTREAQAVAVPVRLGVASDDLIQVEGEVPAGRLVVTKGNERIPPDRSGAGSPVTWQNSLPPEANTSTSSE